MSETVTMKLEISATYDAELLPDEDSNPDEVARAEKVDLTRYVEELLSYIPESRDVTFTIKPVFTP